ncbi:HAMP domain-containing sensor histidine kinase [Leifsonia sp. F6_8S_P_1B]|uniref:histidine kinase n=1 Tax=Leifsonia williamsii TaxID=3035919 RepID=A0ABT8K7P9_9MICO|nr:HAMP domain-containing sensor histidine kinase [Leifsonia williamsii]MDN4612841.1 HAMP domain-containing sensor histidine kinase [Leifsonia williamsii]
MTGGTAGDPPDRELRSASRRLATQFAVIILGLVVALGVVVYVVVAAGQAEAAQRVLADASMVDSPHDAPRNLLVTVVTPDGVQSSPGLPDGLPDRQAIEQVMEHGGTRSSTVEAGGERYLTETDVRHGRVVQISYGLGEQEEELERLLVALVASGVIATVAAAGIGLLLARRAIRPLADALALQRRFVADAGHELRTPLTLLSTRAQLLRRHVAGSDTAGGDEEVRSGLDEIVDDSRALTEIVQDLLTVADPRQTAEVEGVDLAALAQAVARSAAGKAEERGLRIQIDGAREAVVTGAPVSLRRMIVALVDNALDHAATDIALRLSEERDEVVLSVTDDGPGFSPGVEATAFERFASVRDPQQADGRARHYGLGLALVAEVVARHQGTVSAANAEPGGAVVTVRLPRRR